MKVIGINGSPRVDGNTNAALSVMKEEFEKNQIDFEIIHVGREAIRGCINCNYCSKSEGNRCMFKNDMVNEVTEKMRNSDGFVLASPTYYAGIAGGMKSFLDRAFFSSAAGGGYFQNKVCSSMAVVRRAGGVDVVHQLNNFLHLAEVIIAPTQYWNIGYGLEKEQVHGDAEGMQTIRRNAQGMIWLLKMKEATKDLIPAPTKEDRAITNFIR